MIDPVSLGLGIAIGFCVGVGVIAGALAAIRGIFGP